MRRLFFFAAAFSAAAATLIAAAALASSARAPEAMPVRFPEGVVHGFLLLRTLEGEPLADGDLIQLARGDRVTSRLVLRFRGGSVQDETVVFTQRGRFRLLSDHLVQKGPAFPHPMEVSIDGTRGIVTVKSVDDDGKEKTTTDQMRLPANVANGMVLTLIKNIAPGAALTNMSMVAASPKPRVVTLAVSPEGEDSFAVGASARKATRYVVRVEIGGVAGVVAPLVGKQPADTRVWVLGGDAPMFVKSEGPLYSGGPSWRLELATPTWPDSGAR